MSSRSHKIAYQGEPGANSHLACRDAYPKMEPLACPTFEDALAAVKGGEARTRHDPHREFGRRPRRRHSSSVA